MNCKELAYLLADYLDESMDPGMRAELDRHVAGCTCCRVFAQTYRTTCRKAAELRGDIQYEIPDPVRARLAGFIAKAARDYPKEMDKYREQAECECREKVLSFCRAALDGTLSSMASVMAEGHMSVCPECREYFLALRKTAADPCLPPKEILEHVIRLLESLPPGEDLFLD